MRLMEAQMDEFKDSHELKRIASEQATNWIEVRKENRNYAFIAL